MCSHLSQIPGLIFKCSQMKFVAFILVLWSLFYAIFPLTDFSSTLLTFRPHNYINRIKPGGHFKCMISSLKALRLTSLCAIDRNCSQREQIIE